MEKKYLGIKEVSILLGVSKLTLRNWDNTGKLTAKRHPINNYRVYLKEDIEKVINSIESEGKQIKYSKLELNKKTEKKIYKIKINHL